VDTSNTEFVQQLLYEDASQAQHTQVLLSLVDTLKELFPLVSELQWWQAYHHCQPTLWIMDGELDAEPTFRTQLVAWISLLYGPAVDETDRYAPASIHLARQLNSLSKEIKRVLATYQKKTTPQAAEAYLDVLLNLPNEDLIANHLRTPGSFPELWWKQEKGNPQHVSSSLQEVFTWLPERTEELVALQWRSLRHWLQQEDNLLRPWNIGTFSQYLGWPSLLVEQIFYGPKEPAQHPEIFTLERLTRLQVLLLSYRFSFPNCG
jgi:hypothetical protein